MPSVLITGGHKGLGLEATRKIAEQGGHDIIMAGRNLVEVDAAAQRLRNRYGTTIRTVVLDVSSLQSVRSAAEAVRGLVSNVSVSPLQVLLLNAGAQFRGPIEYSADGNEMTFATNCLGHFLLLHLLEDLMQDGGRIVFTASGTHDPDTMDGKMVGKVVEPDAFRLANDGRAGKPLSGGVRYSTSKLCTMLHAYELDRQLRARGSSLQSIAFDPGLIVETGLMRSAPSAAQRLMRTSGMKWILRRMGVTMGSIAFSGTALAKVAIDSAFAAASGKYIQSKNGQLIEAKSSVMSHDKERAHKLWVDCKKIVELG